MKYIAIFTIVLSLVGRVICCGKNVDLNNEINQIDSDKINLTKEIEALLLTSSELNSFTNITADVSQYFKGTPVGYSFSRNSTIALSQ